MNILLTATTIQLWQTTSSRSRHFKHWRNFSYDIPSAMDFRFNCFCIFALVYTATNKCRLDIEESNLCRGHKNISRYMSVQCCLHNDFDFHWRRASHCAMIHDDSSLQYLVFCKLFFQLMYSQLKCGGVTFHPAHINNHCHQHCRFVYLRCHKKWSFIDNLHVLIIWVCSVKCLFTK